MNTGHHAPSGLVVAPDIEFRNGQGGIVTPECRYVIATKPFKLPTEDGRKEDFTFLYVCTPECLTQVPGIFPRRIFRELAVQTRLPDFKRS